MCLLTFLPAGTRPDTTRLAAGARVNADGHGFAIVTGDHLIVDRGMDATPLIRAFDRARRANPDGPALFHSRLATHGRRGLENCHPFAVGADPRTVTAHNGILPAAVHPGRGDHRSDSRIAAEEFLPQFGPLHQKRTRQRLERWLTPANLMVLLTVDRRYRQRAYLFNETAGIWDHGIWYSNPSYLPPPRGRHDRPLDGLWSTESLLGCRGCGAVIDPDELTCPWCDCCWACGHPPQRCTCWSASHLDQLDPPAAAGASLG